MADLTQTQQAFVDRYAPYANLASQQLGLPSRVILAKIALETGYGTHFSNNNLPGLKTGNSGQNDGYGSALTTTKEDYGGKSQVTIKDGFIKYPTPEEGLGGLVPWLSNSTYMNSLADRQGGGIFDRDSAAEASAVKALGTSGFSTDRNASAGVTAILGKLPDLSGYGIAPSFTPSIGQLMNYVPYNGATGMPNVSRGTGDFASNDYWSGEAYQSQGRVLPREKATGLELPSPRMSAPLQAYSALDDISNGLTGGLRMAANAVGQAFVDATGRLPTADEFAQRIESMKSGAANAVSQIAGIAGSDEAKNFQQRTGLDPNRYAIDDIYRLNLGRGASDSDQTSAMGVLQGGVGFGGLAANIGKSQEGQTYALNSFYGNAFGRDIDSSGLQNGLDQLSRGASLQSIEAQLLQSPEAQARGVTRDQIATLLTPSYYASPEGPGTSTGTLGFGGITAGMQGPTTSVGTIGPDTIASMIKPPTGSSVVDALYQAILQRPSDAEGARFYDAALDSGQMDLNAIVAQMQASPEAKMIGAPESTPMFGPTDIVYARQLDRLPDASGAASYGAQLAAGASLPSIEAQIYNSPEATAFRGALPSEQAAMIHAPTTHSQEPGSTSTSMQTGAQTGMQGPTTQVGMQGPTAGETTTAWNGRFDPNDYKAANVDVAASGMDALTHYLTYGYNEGRALDTAGHHVNQGFDPSAYLRTNTDVAAAHMDPLAHYIEHGASEGRALPTGGNPYQFTGINVAQGAGQTGNGTFNGRFDGSQYLAANPDVAAAHVDPLTHYETYGFGEGRALDTAGHRIDKAFDPSKYLQQNQDVAKAGMDPLAHYLEYGAAEGRALPTGSNPYQFSNFNVSQGAGATGNGSFGLGGITSPGGMGSPSSTSALPAFGSGTNVSGGVQNGSFGIGGIATGSPGGGGGGISNPYGFSSANVGGGLGATAQSFGSLFPAGSSQPAAGGIDPYGFSSANVSGFNPNSAGGVEDFGSGAGLGPTQWNDAPSQGGGGGGGGAYSAMGSDPVSENAYLATQQRQLDQRNASLGESNAANVNLANMAISRINNQNQVSQNFTNSQSAQIMSGLGITPVIGSTLYTAPSLVTPGSIGVAAPAFHSLNIAGSSLTPLGWM